MKLRTTMVTAVLTALVLTGCGAREKLSPPLAMRNAANSTVKAKQGTFTFSIVGSEADLNTVLNDGAKLSEEDRKGLQLLGQSHIALTTAENQFGLDVKVGGIDHAVELRYVGKKLYVRADVPAIAKLMDASPDGLAIALPLSAQRLPRFREPPDLLVELSRLEEQLGIARVVAAPFLVRPDRRLPFLLVDARRGKHGVGLADDAVRRVGEVQAAAEVMRGYLKLPGGVEIRHAQVEEDEGMVGPIPEVQLQQPEIAPPLECLSFRRAVVVAVAHVEVREPHLQARPPDGGM